MESQVTISIVIPVFNEENNLDELVSRCLASCEETESPFEIILIDDGSIDDSRNIIAHLAEAHAGKVLGVFLNRNYGQHAAIMAGFSRCKGEVVVTLDADLQNPPEEIPRLLSKIKEGFDVVGTVRVDRQDSFFRRASSTLVNKMVQRATRVMMHDYGCMLRAYRRNIVEAMLQCHERSTFVPVLANSFARRTTEIEVQHNQRTAGNSQYSLWKLVNLQFDLLTCMTTFPLRLLAIMGILLSFTGVGFSVLILVLRFLLGSQWAAQGVFTLFAILFIFMGAQFIAVGLLGEYIGRIYNDVRARPRYFVESSVGQSALPDTPAGIRASQTPETCEASYSTTGRMS